MSPSELHLAFQFFAKLAANFGPGLLAAVTVGYVMAALFTPSSPKASKGKPSNPVPNPRFP